MNFRCNFAAIFPATTFGKILTIFMVVLSLPVLAQSNQKKQEARSCDAHLAIMPPVVRDTVRGEELVDIVADQISKKSNLICSSSNFVAQSRSRRAFDFIGATFYFGLNPKSLGSRQVRYLIEELQATHVVEIQIPETSGNQRDFAKIKVSIYEIDVEEKTIDRKIQAFELPYAETVKSLSSTNSYLRTLALLTPNAATLGSVTTRVTFQMSDGYNNVSTKSRGILPPIISSVGFNKIEHYRNFSLFGYSGTVFPSSFLFAIDQVSTIEKKRTSETDPLDIRQIYVKMFGGCLLATGQAAFHSPIGTTYLGLGAGPCVYENRQDEKDPIFYGTSAFRVLMGHRMFVSQDYYIFFDIDVLGFSGSAIYRSEIASSNTVARSNLGIGWYLPEVERLYTDFWRKKL